MNKRVLSCMLILLGLTTALFAAGNAETSAVWNKANAVADSSVGYIPLARSLTFEQLTKDGQVIDSKTAEVSNELTHYGSTIERTVLGDNSILALADVIYDGTVITPFENDLMDYSYTYVEDQTVNGVKCAVYDTKIAFDQALLYFNDNYSASGNIIGWNSDDGELSGDATIRVHVDKATGAIVKQINNYSLADSKVFNNLAFTQEVTYESKTVDGKTIAYPINTITKGSYKTITSGSSIKDAVYFQIIDNASNVVLDSKFSRG